MPEWILYFLKEQGERIEKDRRGGKIYDQNQSGEVKDTLGIFILRKEYVGAVPEGKRSQLFFWGRLKVEVDAPFFPAN